VAGQNCRIAPLWLLLFRSFVARLSPLLQSLRRRACSFLVKVASRGLWHGFPYRRSGFTATYDKQVPTCLFSGPFGAIPPPQTGFVRMAFPLNSVLAAFSSFPFIGGGAAGPPTLMIFTSFLLLRFCGSRWRIILFPALFSQKHSYLRRRGDDRDFYRLLPPPFWTRICQQGSPPAGENNGSGLASLTRTCRYVLFATTRTCRPPLPPPKSRMYLLQPPLLDLFAPRDLTRTVKRPPRETPAEAAHSLRCAAFHRAGSFFQQPGS